MFFLACIDFLFILFVVALPSNVKTVLTEGFIFLKWSQETKFFCVNRLELVKAVHFQVWTKRLLGHFLCFLLTSGFLAAWAGLGAGVRLQRERAQSAWPSCDSRRPALSSSLANSSSFANSTPSRLETPTLWALLNFDSTLAIPQQVSYRLQSYIAVLTQVLVLKKPC